MGLASPHNTLAYQLCRPLSVRRSMVGCSTEVVAKHLNEEKARLEKSSPRPERDAILFYLLQHATALVRNKRDENETLSPEEHAVFDAYAEHCNEMAMRMVVYLTLICTRETRHVYSGDGFQGRLLSKWGGEIRNFQQKISGASSGGAVNYFLLGPPDVDFGSYAASLSWIFYQGHFSGGYGGEKWGGVADCLDKFVSGEWSAEMMLDTAFTLAHNNGPIFNKGLVYSGYDHTLARILDVQASGQIPQLLADAWGSRFGIAPIVDSTIQGAYDVCLSALGNALTGYVDWWKVERDGKNSYGNFKGIQKNLHGVPESAAAAEKAKAAHDAAIEAEKQVAQYSDGLIDHKKSKRSV